MKLYKRGKTWYVDAREEGKGRISTGTQDERKAHEFAKRMLRGIGNGHTLSDALNRAWDEHYQHTKGARNVYYQAQRLVYRWGDVKLTRIDTPWLKKVQGDLNKTTSTPTANRYMALLGKTLGLAVEWGWISVKPQVPRGKEGEHRIRVISPEEEQELYRLFSTHAFVDPRFTIRNGSYRWMEDFVAFLVDTGARLSEACSITSKDQDRALRTGKWTIWETKGGKARTIPLTGRARHALGRWGWQGKAPGVVQDAWAWVRREMGLEGDKGFVIHALRHTCATRLVDRDVPLPVIRDYLGHASVTTTERYAHLNPRALEAAVLCLESVPSGEYDGAFAVDGCTQVVDLPSGNKWLAKGDETVNLTAQPSVVQIHPPPPYSESTTYDPELDHY